MIRIFQSVALLLLFTGNLNAGKPNIIFFLADDLGYGDLTCYSADSKIPTPNLDRLAKEDMPLTDAHSPSGVCTPTPYAVLAGHCFWRTNLKKSFLRGDLPPLIELDRITVGDLLQKNGYCTGKFGKWHLDQTWQLKDHSGKMEMCIIDWSLQRRVGILDQGFDGSHGLAKPG